MEYERFVHLGSEWILRDFEERDIPAFSSYWMESDPVYLHNLGIDVVRLKQLSGLEQRLKDRIHQPPETTNGWNLALENDGKLAGFGVIKDLVFGSHAGCHVHLLNAKDRAQGVVSRVFVRAMEIFFERFKLNRVEFTPLSTNPASNGLLKKMGIRYVGNRIGKGGDMAREAEMSCYELTRDELIELKNRIQVRRS